MKELQKEPVLHSILINDRWYKSDGREVSSMWPKDRNTDDGQKNNLHTIHIIWNGEDKKTRKEVEKNLIKWRRHGRETLDIERKSNSHKIHIRELQKTLRDKEIIYDRIYAVNKLVKDFGYKPMIRHDLNRLHFVKQGDIEMIYEGQIVDAFFDPFGNCITADKVESDIEKALVEGHEKLHEASPTIWQVRKEKVVPYRQGTKTIDQDMKVHLGEVDEALTSDLNYYLYKTTMQNSDLYREEMMKVKKIKDWVKAEWMEEIKRRKILGEVILLEDIRLVDIYTIRGAEKLLNLLESSPDFSIKLHFSAF